MKVVWVSPSLPHPQAAGGWAHEFELIHALTDRHDIHVLSCDLDSGLDLEPLLDAGAAVARVPWRPQLHPQGALGVAALLPQADPSIMLWLKRDRIRALSAALRDIDATFAPDLVHVTLGELAPLVDATSTRTALLLFDSLTREIEGRLAVESRPRRRLQLRVEQRRTRRFERRWYPRATGIACVSSVDAAWFTELLGRPVDVIENPIPDAFFEPPTVPRSTSVVSFVGTLNHHPNADAIEWIASAIWPLVREKRPEAELRVVGRADVAGVLSARLRALIEGVGGRLDTDVDDVRPCYWEAAVALAPMRLGGGVRNKVIHAMACGAPVVATPAAVEGVPAGAYAHARIGATAEELAAAIVATLDDPAESAAHATAAAAAVAPLRTGPIAERFDAWWRVAAACA